MCILHILYLSSCNNQQNIFIINLKHAGILRHKIGQDRNQAFEKDEHVPLYKQLFNSV